MISVEHKKYITYLLKYLGVALIAGSVVHVGTLHNGTTRYIVLGIIGLVLMISGNILESKQTGEKIDFKYFVLITTLSLATGFFSGGIQHYLDNPRYAGYLLATGLLCSYIIFFLKDKTKLHTKNILVVALIALGIVVISLNLPYSTISDHHSPVQQENSPHTDPPGTPAHTH